MQIRATNCATIRPTRNLSMSPAACGERQRIQGLRETGFLNTEGTSGTVGDVPDTLSNTVGGNLIRVQVAAPAPGHVGPPADSATIS